MSLSVFEIIGHGACFSGAQGGCLAEVVGALREVGRHMPRMYKETSEGGLATTPSGLKFLPAAVSKL